MTALKQGNDALKAIQKEVSLDDVEQLMLDSAEAQEYQERLALALGVSWTGEDEAASEAALADLEAEVAEEMAAEFSAVPATGVAVQEAEAEELPSVPTRPAAAAAAVAGQRMRTEPLPAS